VTFASPAVTVVPVMEITPLASDETEKVSLLSLKRVRALPLKEATTAGVTLSSRPMSSSLLLCIRGLILGLDFLEPKRLRKKLLIYKYLSRENKPKDRRQTNTLNYLK
jgi:hypothetical protein